MLSPIAARPARALPDMLEAGTLPKVRAADVLTDELGRLAGDLEPAVRIVLADVDHLAQVEQTWHVHDARHRGHRRDVEDQLAVLWHAATAHAGPNGARLR